MRRIVLAPLCLVIFVATSFAQQPPGPPWIEVTPAEANQHLLKSAECTYPPFARAAGIEGMVTIGIGIYTDGRIHSIAVQSGSSSLVEAAQACVAKRVYRPFAKNGALVNATTTTTVTFKLPDGEKPKTFPPPKLTRDNFTFMSPEHEAKELSPRLQHWLKKKTADDCGDADSDENGTNVYSVPVSKPGTRLYIVSREKSCLCGATGNCPIEVVEESASGVRKVFQSGGWGVAVVPRTGADFPDIFFIAHMSASEAAIGGYGNVGGHWGPLYCGEILFAEEESEPKVTLQECK